MEKSIEKNLNLSIIALGKDDISIRRAVRSHSSSVNIAPTNIPNSTKISATSCIPG